MQSISSNDFALKWIFYKVAKFGLSSMFYIALMRLDQRDQGSEQFKAHGYPPDMLQLPIFLLPTGNADGLCFTSLSLP